MSFWKPVTDFEKEVVNAQPNRNFIFGSIIPQPKPKRKELDKPFEDKKPALSLIDKQQQVLAVITATESIAKLKPLGERCRLEDWDDDSNVENEIKAMIRHVEETEERKRTAHNEKINSKYLNTAKVVSPKFFRNSSSKKKSLQHKEILDEKYFKFSTVASSKTSTNSDTYKSIDGKSSHNDSDERFKTVRYKVYESSENKKQTKIIAALAGLQIEDTSIATPSVKVNESNNEVQNRKLKESIKLYTPKEIYEMKRKQSRSKNK